MGGPEDKPTTRVRNGPRPPALRRRPTFGDRPPPIMSLQLVTGILRVEHTAGLDSPPRGQDRFLSRYRTEDYGRNAVTRRHRDGQQGDLGRGDTRIETSLDTASTSACATGMNIAKAINMAQERSNSADAGQSGDSQGLADSPEADSQSVSELVEEGQSIEAAAIQGVESASNSEESEVKTRQVPEDDVPLEYLDQDRP